MIAETRQGVPVTPPPIYHFEFTFDEVACLREILLDATYGRGTSRGFYDGGDRNTLAMGVIRELHRLLGTP